MLDLLIPTDCKQIATSLSFSLLLREPTLWLCPSYCKGDMSPFLLKVLLYDVYKSFNIFLILFITPLCFLRSGKLQVIDKDGVYNALSTL